MKITVKAPAKINLTLDIVGKRADGYHDVAMVMQTVSLYDTVTVERLSGEGGGTQVRRAIVGRCVVWGEVVGLAGAGACGDH